MTFFPVPHHTPPQPVAHIVRGPAAEAVKRPAVENPDERQAQMPEELRRIVAETSQPRRPENTLSPLPEALSKPPEELSLPSMTQMAKNVLGSLGKTIKAAATGQGVKVTQETAEARLAICRSCPFFRTSDERCSKCGCYMAVKTYLRAEKCPVGKW